MDKTGIGLSRENYSGRNGLEKLMAKNTAPPRVGDLRNIYSNIDAKRAVFDAYISIGRIPLEPSNSGDT